MIKEPDSEPLVAAASDWVETDVAYKLKIESNFSGLEIFTSAL